jgi:hypothetical protein
MKNLFLFTKCANYGCHYGDLFTCKGYIKQILDELGDKINIRYWHECHPNALLDLNLDSFELNFTKQELFESYIDTDQGLYVNLWRAQREEFNGKIGVNHEFLQRAWTKIFAKINSVFATDLKVKQMEFYVPEINYKLFNGNKNLNSYIENTKDIKKILICNGPATSGQSFADDMSEEIIRLATVRPNFHFICTKKFFTNRSNIKFTDDIINQDKQIFNNESVRLVCDLNEISYLSTFCNMIVGKNSGPFIYCLTKENLFNKNQIIVSLHKRRTDDMLLYLKYNCKYEYHQLFEKNYNSKIAFDILNNTIQNKLI